MKILSRILSTFFGIGHFPLAPGTVASFAFILLYRYYFYRLSWPVYLLCFFILFAAGVFASSRHASELKKKDPRVIVVDEAAAQMFVLFRLPPSWPLLLLGFFLFRFFDVIKPFPIKKTENFPSGWGIMLDDIVAAVYSGIIIQIYLLLR